MPTFSAAGGQFWLDGLPQLIQAGEFHYFRAPVDQWRDRLSRLQDSGFNAVAAYIPWLWHQLDEDVSDFDGRSHPMRDLAGFLDLAQEMGLYIIARPGPYIMAETLHEGIPAWVFTKYPGAAFINQHGVAQNIVSYMHPAFLACVKQWYQAIFGVLTPRQVTRGGSIIMVQLDNEMGMMQWVRNIFDINPDTLERFAGHLRRAYGPELAERYPAADPSTGSGQALPAFLEAGLSTPAEAYGARIVEDYRRFYRDYLREYAEFLLAEALANGLDVPPVINIHGFMNGGRTFPIGISQLAAVMEMDGVLSATDVYPGHIDEGNFHQLLLVNETTKAMHNKAQALFSIEFQAGGINDFATGQSSLYDLHTRLCVSCGMRAINHYLFFDGENDPLLSPVKRHDWGHAVRLDGTVRSHYARYGRLSKVLTAYGQALVAARPETAATIGFQLDDFMTEVNNEFTREATEIITHQREIILFDMIGKGLAVTHRPFEAIELSRAELTAERAPVCWVMMEKTCPAATQQKLVDYVRGGGRLILAGRMCVEDGQHQPCAILKNALGIGQIASDMPFARTHISAFGHTGIPASFVEAYTGDFAEVVATRDGGEVVGFIQPLGQGRVLMFGAAVPAYTLDDLDLVKQMAAKMDSPALLSLSTWADARLSRGQQGSFLFLNNYQDDPVETIVAYGGETLFGGHPVHIPARQGQILPLDWKISPGVTVNYITTEVNGVETNGERLTLKTRLPEFFAELSLTGHECDGAAEISADGPARRVAVQGQNGELKLIKTG